MASDDEFRRVAEEIRALAKSLARDFRDAVDQSRAGGDRPGQAVRHGLRDVADEARRNMYGTLADLRPRHRGPRSRHRGWYPPTPPAGGMAQQHPYPYPRRSGQHSRPRRRGLPPVRHRWDATTVIGALAVVFGVAWLLDAVHAAHISAEGAVAVGLMLLGAAMIVTGRTDWSLSRRSWPVFAGAALILVLIATSNTFGAGSGASAVSFGNRTVNVRNSGRAIQGGFGNLTVDAEALTGGGKVTIANVAGNVRVLLPRGVPAHIDARVLAGEICVNGRNVASGLQASAQRDLPGDPAIAALVVDVHEASGEIVVGSGGCAR